MQDPVAKLEAFVRAASLRFSVASETAELRSESIREVTIRDVDASRADSGSALVVPVFDEYRDSEIGSQVVLLHLVLDACECFEEAGDEATWRADLGFRDSPLIRSVYSRLRDVVPRVRARVGHEVVAVASHEIEFGTAVANRLRACRDD